MKKILITLTAAAALFATQNTKAESNETMEALKAAPFYDQIMKAKKAGLPLKAEKVDGLYIYELKTGRGPITFYITADKKYTFVGKAFDNKTKKPITFTKHADIINKGVMFTFGNGKKEIYLVTDPECPFCRKMEHEKGKILEKDYKVHVILMPLSFHKHAKAMSYYILAGKTDKERAQRMKEVLKGSEKWKNYHPTKEEIKKYEEELKKAKEAARELDAMGTPSVFDKDFNPIAWPILGEEK